MGPAERARVDTLSPKLHENRRIGALLRWVRRPPASRGIEGDAAARRSTSRPPASAAPAESERRCCTCPIAPSQLQHRRTVWWSFGRLRTTLSTVCTGAQSLAPHPSDARTHRCTHMSAICVKQAGTLPLYDLPLECVEPDSAAAALCRFSRRAVPTSQVAARAETKWE